MYAQCATWPSHYSLDMPRHLGMHKTLYNIFKGCLPVLGTFNINQQNIAPVFFLQKQKTKKNKEKKNDMSGVIVL